MDETELAEIESRILEYPVQARRDILKLAAELRSLRGFSEPLMATRSSALYDSVTGLLSGGAYGVRFAGAMARATRYRRRFAVMSIDLALSKDKPRPGESTGALKQVARRLEQCVRAADTLARIDHEKFAIILEDLPQDGQAHQVTEKVQLALSEPTPAGEPATYRDAAISIRYYPTTQSAASAPPFDRLS